MFAESVLPVNASPSRRRVQEASVFRAGATRSRNGAVRTAWKDQVTNSLEGMHPGNCKMSFHIPSFLASNLLGGFVY